MSNVVSNLFISNLKKCFFHHKLGIHAKLPGRIFFPYPIFGSDGSDGSDGIKSGLYGGTNTTIAPVT